jgi:glycosyltransferase involved in cell wall biosynthesis
VANVADLMPFYQAASVFVAPLFVRGGLKFKVPQAMLCGLPVVATPVAAEGVGEVAPAGIFWSVTDNADQMAASIVAALSDPDQAAAAGAAAARWCAEHYSFRRSIADLADLYSQIGRAAPS